MKIENSHCGGRAVLTTPSDKVCHSSPFLWTTSEKLKLCNSIPENAKTRALRTTLTPSPSMSAPVPASSSVSPWSSTTTCSRTPFPQQFCLQGHMEVDGNGKMSSGRTYNWLRICLYEVISSCRITFFSDIPWNSNTWLSIDGFTCLINLLLTHYKFDEFVCQQWRQHDISRNRWGTKLKLSSFQNFAFFDLLTH